MAEKREHMYKERKFRVQKEWRNTGDKSVIMGCWNAAARFVPPSFQSIFGANVEPGTQIYPDEHGHQ